MNKTDISSLSPTELADYLSALSDASGVKIEKFRAKQIYTWLTKGVSSFDEMGNIPKPVKQALEDYAFLTLPAIEKKLVSKIDGTVKYLFRLYDGALVESVFMRYEHGLHFLAGGLQNGLYLLCFNPYGA